MKNSFIANTRKNIEELKRGKMKIFLLSVAFTLMDGDEEKMPYLLKMCFFFVVVVETFLNSIKNKLTVFFSYLYSN